MNLPFVLNNLRGNKPRIGHWLTCARKGENYFNPLAFVYFLAEKNWTIFVYELSYEKPPKKELEIKDELTKKEMRDILVGTDMSTERPYRDLTKAKIGDQTDSAQISTFATMDTSQPLITGKISIFCLYRLVGS